MSGAREEQITSVKRNKGAAHKSGNYWDKETRKDDSNVFINAAFNYTVLHGNANRWGSWNVDFEALLRQKTVNLISLQSNKRAFV